MNESLTKAMHSAGFMVSELREAHAGSSNLESLVLLPLIGRAANLEHDIAALLEAVEAK